MESNLYTKPKTPIHRYIPGMEPGTSKFAGQRRDGFVTNELNVDISIKTVTKIQRRKKDSNKLEKICLFLLPTSYFLLHTERIRTRYCNL
jgi:hypothetical protein